MPRSRAVERGRTPVDQDHDVVSMVGGGGYRKEPCVPCPWVRENAGDFPAEAFRVTANTAEDHATESFGCHETGTEHVMTCAGFLLRGAEHNIGVRMKLITGEIDMSKVREGDRELHAGYLSMACANGVSTRDPAMRNVRLSSYEEEETN